MGYIRRFNGKSNTGARTGPRILGTTARFGVESAATNVIDSEFGWVIDAPASNPPIDVLKLTVVQSFKTVTVPSVEYIPVSTKAFTQTLNGEGNSSGSTGVLSPTGASDTISKNWAGKSTSGTWAGTGNLGTSNNSYATSSSSSNGWHWLALNYDFSSIPIGAALTAMTITVEGKVGSGTNQPRVYLAYNIADTATNALVAATEQTNTGAAYPTWEDSAWGTTETTTTLGPFTPGAWLGDGLGRTPNGTDLRRANCQFVIGRDSSFAGPTISVDHVTVNVSWEKIGLRIVDDVKVPVLTFTQDINPGGAPINTDTGWLTGPSTSDVGPVPWTDIGNINSSDNLYATATLTAADYTFTTISGFLIPYINTVDGIEIEVEAKCTVSGAYIALGLAYNSAGGSTNPQMTALTTSDTTYTFGGPTDLLGADLTPILGGYLDTSTITMVAAGTDAASSFGMPAGGNGTYSVDKVRLKYYYVTDGWGGTIINAPAGEIISVDAKSFAQTLFAPVVNAREVVAVPKLTQTQTFLSVNVNAREVIAVPKLTQTQTFLSVNVNAREVIAVPKLTQTQTFLSVNINAKTSLAIDAKSFAQTLFAPVVNAREVVAVPKLTEVQSLFAPIIIETSSIAVDTKAFTQTFLSVNVNAKEFIAVPKLAQTQTFYSVKISDLIFVSPLPFTQTFNSVNVNAREVIAVPKLTQTQSLFAPVVNAREVIAVPKLTQTQTYPSVNVNAKTSLAIDAKSFAQTLFAPVINAREVIAVPKLTQVQTTYSVKISDLIFVEAVAYVQSLFAPTVLESSAIQPPVLSFTQTFNDATVNAREVVAVLALTQTQTLFALIVNAREVIAVTKLTQVQTFLSVNVNAREVVAVPKLTQTQALFAPAVNASSGVVVDTKTFTQTLIGVAVNAKEVIDVPKLTQVQTFRTANINESLRISALLINETLYSVNVKESLGINSHAFAQTLYAPSINDIVPISCVGFVQVLYTPQLPEVISVDLLHYTESLNAPYLSDIVAINVLNYLETLFVPVIDIDVVKTFTAEITYMKWVAVGENGAKQISVTESYVVPIQGRTSANLIATPTITGRLASPPQITGNLVDISTITGTLQ